MVRRWSLLCPRCTTPLQYLHNTAKIPPQHRYTTATTPSQPLYTTAARTRCTAPLHDSPPAPETTCSSVIPLSCCSSLPPSLSLPPLIHLQVPSRHGSRVVGARSRPTRALGCTGVHPAAAAHGPVLLGCGGSGQSCNARPPSSRRGSVGPVRALTRAWRRPGAQSLSAVRRVRRSGTPGSGR